MKESRDNIRKYREEGKGGGRRGEREEKGSREGWGKWE